MQFKLGDRVDVIGTDYTDCVVCGINEVFCTYLLRHKLQVISWRLYTDLQPHVPESPAIAKTTPEKLIEQDDYVWLEYDKVSVIGQVIAKNQDEYPGRRYVIRIAFDGTTVCRNAEQIRLIPRIDQPIFPHRPTEVASLGPNSNNAQATQPQFKPGDRVRCVLKAAGLENIYATVIIQEGLYADVRMQGKVRSFLVNNLAPVHAFKIGDMVSYPRNVSPNAPIRVAGKVISFNSDDGRYKVDFFNSSRSFYPEYLKPGD